QQPDHLRADHAATEERNAQSGLHASTSASSRSRSSALSRRMITRDLPPRTATTLRSGTQSYLLAIDRQYAPVEAPATRSPAARSSGNHTSRTTMSPLSQCLPTSLLSMGDASDDLLASTAVYSAPYRAVRRLSLMPPSTDTYVRMPSTSLTVPTSYRVMPPGPTIARPGSTVSRGIVSSYARHSRATISRSESAIVFGSCGSSPGT